MKPNSDNDRFPVLNVVPEFDPLNKGQTVESWIHKVDECAQIYGWNDRQIVHYAMPKLNGIAKTWYQGLPSLLHSWSEWKIKLRESFPTRENYAELLTEMLNKRARYGESLDLYYYTKMNLLNRCEITGRRAVDCLLAGIDDRNVRVGGQSAEFKEPEQVLNFFKSVKVGNDKINDSAKIRDREKRIHSSINNDKMPNISQGQKTQLGITCYNCNERGHPFFRCPKPKLHCSNCKLLGHLASDCPKLKQGAVTDNKSKNILKIDDGQDTSLKYKIPIKINNKLTSCVIDLGSEGTLIQLSEAKRLQLQWQAVNGPILKDPGHLLDVLVVGSDDWLTTYQQSDEEIKRIADLLNDPKTKETTETFKNYKLVNDRVYRVLDDATIRCYFGTPNRIITDQGTSFTSNTFKKYIKSTGIKHVLNAVSTPRANGQVERYNRTILAALGAMNHNKPNGVWDEHLPDIQLGINTTIHATTKKTPTELLFGRTVTNPSQSIFNEIITDTRSATPTSLSDIRSEVGELIREQQSKDKDIYDAHRNKNVIFKVGDLVRVIRTTTGIEGQSKKLDPKCRGPYRIKKVLPNDRYIVEDTPITRKGKRYEAIIAVDKIFPWLVMTQPVPTDDELSDDNNSELNGSNSS
ncbi:unnamed protein product [Leptosia nina]|uniref:Endonuclease n=1 Tax=Leptosia nina TaxID=320188 RepID=A0AAV1JPY0_9NEOP